MTYIYVHFLAITSGLIFRLSRSCACDSSLRSTFLILSNYHIVLTQHTQWRMMIWHVLMQMSLVSFRMSGIKEMHSTTSETAREFVLQ
jgi:hypothetical protein